jgi:hypothetical protein
MNEEGFEPPSRPDKPVFSAALCFILIYYSIAEQALQLF